MYFVQTINIYLFLFILIISFSSIKCLEKTLRDNDYPYKYRLNNGNYLVIITTGIYLYNPTFTSKIEVKAFNPRILNTNEDSYPTNIAQFLSEDGGYVICIIKENIYVISKNGKYLNNISIDYIKYYDKESYPIIPLENLGNDYYFVIITKEGNKIIFRKYKYNSNDNQISYINNYDYYCSDGEKNNISCELMYYTDSKDGVIFCFYGSYYKSFGTIFNITDFNEISGMGAELNDAGGQIFKTNINSAERNKVVCCAQHSGDAGLTRLRHVRS